MTDVLVMFGVGQPCWVISLPFPEAGKLKPMWCPVVEIHQIDEQGATLLAAAVADRLNKVEVMVQKNPACVHVAGTAAFPNLDGSGYVLERPPGSTPKATDR